MPTTRMTRLAEIVRTHEKEILAEWIARQLESVTTRRDLMNEGELRRQSQDFLAAFVEAAEVGIDDPHSFAWTPVHELLTRISRTRAAQGFTPSETATFVFSLKQPVFEQLRKSVNDVDMLADEMWAATLAIDALGLFTTEAYQKGREDVISRQQQEMQDTNRGVVALYAELEERADHRSADDLKTRFLSNMTHEFRTPVNSILALTGLLAERLGSSADQKDELFYLRKSAQQLSDLVDDLLDLAKVEAGKIEIRPAPFEVDALFGALRGMLRPLLLNQSLSLVFEEPDDVPPIFSDESKLSQILRNFISNALKYTERGQVRVSARRTPDRSGVEFAVADTGIGIPDQDVGRVFDEFVQIENPLQRRVKGTGLGLPLSKRLAELLGGSVSVKSTFGVGSTFSVTIPLVYRAGRAEVVSVQPGRVPVLVVEDSDEDLMIVERLLANTRFQVVPARTIAAAATALDVLRPAAIVLDLRLQGREAWDFMTRLKRDTRTADIPIVVASTIDDRQKGFALGAAAYGIKPIDRQWLIDTLETVSPLRKTVRVLTVDDEETYRFIVRGMLNDSTYSVSEAASGIEGLRLTHELVPDVVLLDLRLTDMTGVDMTERLRRDPRTAHVPIILMTSQFLSADEHERFGVGRPVLSKTALTRDTLRAAIHDALGEPRGRQPEVRA